MDRTRSGALILLHALVAFLGLMCVPCVAQTAWKLTQTLISPALQNFGQRFGTGMMTADFNHDGFDDLVFSEPKADVTAVSQSGYVWIYYGPTFKTFTRIAAAHPKPHEFMGSVRGSIGDVNGDGELDILIPSPEDNVGSLPWVGRAHLFLGPDYTTDIVFTDPTPERYGRFGHGNLLLDVNSDGLDDVLLGAPSLNYTGSTSFGEWWLFDATDLSRATQIPNAFPPIATIFGVHQFGSSITAGDVDNDGDLEVLVTADTYKPPTPGNSGAIAIFDIPSFEVVQTVEANDWSSQAVLQRFGKVHHVGDMDGDGFADIVASAPMTYYFGPPTNSDSGVWVLVKGPHFTDFRAFYSPQAADNIGFATEVIVADVNGDGFDDVLAGDPGVSSATPGASVYVFYGPDFQQLQWMSTKPLFNNSGFGWAIASGDFDGDDHVDVTVMELGAAGEGRIHVFDARTLEVAKDEVFLSHPTLSRFELDAGLAQANNAYVALLSLTGSDPGTVPSPGVFVPLNLDPLTQFGLATLGAPPLPGLSGFLNAKGKAQIRLKFSADIALLTAGSKLSVAVVTLLPSGQLGIGSNAIQLSVRE